MKRMEAKNCINVLLYSFRQRNVEEPSSEDGKEDRAE